MPAISNYQKLEKKVSALEKEIGQLKQAVLSSTPAKSYLKSLLMSPMTSSTFATRLATWYMPTRLRKGFWDIS